MKNKSENISRHCGRGPRVQGCYKEKNTLLNRLDPGYPAGRPSGMTTRSAFTLIELLVGVLIIGILAAVAVPQYQLAVAKSRIGGLMTIGKSIWQAEELYYINNGSYTPNWDELSLSVPGNKSANYASRIEFATGTITLASIGVYFSAKQVNGVGIYFWYTHIDHVYKGQRTCYAKMDNDFANKVCKSLTGEKTPSSNNGPDTDNIYFF